MLRLQAQGMFGQRRDEFGNRLGSTSESRGRVEYLLAIALSTIRNVAASDTA